MAVAARASEKERAVAWQANPRCSTHRRNTAIVEGAGEGVLELDNVGQVRYANPAAAKLLGYEIEELPGLDYRVLINTQSDDDNRTDPVRRVRYTTDIMRGVGALLRRKNGQFRPVEYRIVPVTEQGATVGTVLVFHDVGERVRLDNLLKDMQTTARIGGWEYDVETKKFTGPKRCTRSTTCRSASRSRSKPAARCSIPRIARSWSKRRSRPPKAAPAAICICA